MKSTLDGLLDYFKNTSLLLLSTLCCGLIVKKVTFYTSLGFICALTNINNKKMKLTLLIISLFICFDSLAQKPDAIFKEKEKTLTVENIEFQLKFQKIFIENQNLKESMKDLKSDIQSQIKETKNEFEYRLNIYVLFIGLVLSLIAWAFNFFGKIAIKKRVEGIIKLTADNYAQRKIDSVLAERITDEYTSKIIREKGEPEIKRLLVELENKGRKTIDEIKEKGNAIINSVWAAPPQSKNEKFNSSESDDNIEKKHDNIRADEFFNLAFKTKDPKIRIALYNNVLELEPKNVKALNNTGAAYNERGDYKKAIDHLTNAINLNKSYGLAYSNRAYAFNKLDKFEEAISDASKAIEYNPALEAPYATIGNVYTKQHKFVEADEILTKAIKINPKSGIAYFNRGFFNEETKRYSESKQDYLKAESLGYPSLPELYNNLAVACRRLNKLDEAMEYLHKVREINPKHPNLAGTMALVYSDKGNDAKFYEYIKIALDNNCPVWNYLNDYAFDPYRDQEKLKKLIEPYKKNYEA
jgi:tetratricopeptide (TPR) repeat protein